MATRNVELNAAQSDLVASLIDGERYESADDVVGEALALLVSYETADDAEKLARLRIEAQIGMDALLRGDYEEFPSIEDFVAHLRRFGEDLIAGKADE